MELPVRNVNDAFSRLILVFHTGRLGRRSIPQVIRPSRYGEVIMIEEPVLVSYEQPCERVLFNQARDANPFFHLYEALWMLAGRQDVGSLAYYNKRMLEFSDDGTTINDAYGYRWRHASRSAIHAVVGAQPLDQLDILVEHLKNKPESRRAVLQMWNVQDDLTRIDTSRAVACNTAAYFAVGMGRCFLCGGTGQATGTGESVAGSLQPCPGCKGMPHDVPRFLDMTVTNRSNDMVWGLCGANAVHFSFLQEYLACRLGLLVGTYHQFTNNLHVYTNNWKPQEWLEDDTPDFYEPRISHPDVGGIDFTRHFPLVKDHEVFDKEIIQFVQHNKDHTGFCREWEEPFLNKVAQPICDAWRAYKAREAQVMGHVQNIQAPDWRVACRQWINRRLQRNKG